MAKSIVAVILVAGLALGCSSENTNPDIFGTPGGGAGAAGAGVGSAAGVGGAAGADADAAIECPSLMVRSGDVCVDKQPALHADGSQDAAVSWTEAVTICEVRGARLCTEAEREGACPDGQVSLDTPANGVYCGGPASTWEWSSSTSCPDGRCKSPCCNSVTNPCHCSVPPTEALSYRCCKNLN